LGLKEDFTFQPVCQHPDLTERMLELLEMSQMPIAAISSITTDEKAALEQAHYPYWLNNRAAHIEQVTQTTQARLASLNTSHTARLALLEEQRDTNADVNIQRMKNSQIASASRDYLQRAEELQKAPEQADVIAEAVAFGVLIIEEKL
jgi:hypothetical protein